MTVDSLVFPLLAAVMIIAIATSAHRRLPPWLAARFVTAASIVVLVAAIPTALVLALAFLAHTPVAGLGFRWCAQVIGLHASVPAWLGLPMLGLVALGALRSVRVIRQHRALRSDVSQPIRVAESHEPYAVTLPGRAGQIVISSAMFDLLDDVEQRIVVAHEEAHARHRHDRYLLAAALGEAALPPLRLISRRIAYSVERWADEAAVAVCGDRELVAVTLGRVALRTHPSVVAGFAGLGVAARVEALLEPPVRRPRRAHLLALWSSLAVAAGFSVYQLHHLERLLTALCPH